MFDILSDKTKIITKDRLLHVKENIKDILDQCDNDFIRCTELKLDKYFKFEEKIIYLNKSFINEIIER